MEAPKELYAARGKFTHVCCTESKIYNIKYLRADLAVDREKVLDFLKRNIEMLGYCLNTDLNAGEMMAYQHVAEFIEKLI